MQTQTPPKHTDALSLSLSLTHTHTYTYMKAYLALDGRMQSLPDFESVLLDDEIMLAGADAKVLTEENGDRRAKHRNNFIRRMELSERCKIYSYNPNGGKEAHGYIAFLMSMTRVLIPKRHSSPRSWGSMCQCITLVGTEQRSWLASQG